jgi:imidazolonepropionase-like amidohydrolase
MTPGTAPWARMIDDKTDIRKAVADAKATGAVALKLYERLTADQVKALTAEAHRQGMKVWSHAAVFPAGPSDVVDAGVDSISHSDGLIYAAVTPVWEEYRKLKWKIVKPDAPQVVALLKEMRRKGVVLDATLHIYDENVEYDLEEKPENQNKWYVDQQEWAYQVTRLAHQLGVTIVAGTDYPERPRRRNGVANIHFEMELLTTKAGMTAAEALRAATLNGARLLGVDRLYGSIEPGKIADLVVIDGDPLADIRNTRRVAYIIKGGVPHKSEAVKMPDQ